jgi:hypothetical protein
MAEQYIYRIWCNDEAAYVETDWVTSEPTECPNDPGHSIDTNNIAIIKTSPPYLAIDGSNTPEADIDFNAKKITNLANPTTSQEASTKSYTDVLPNYTYVLTNADNNPYMIISSSTFKTFAAFVYEGSNVHPVSEIMAIGSRTGTSGTVYLRLYDVTNSNEIVQVTWTSEDQQIITSSSLTNIPTGQAIFEIQAREDGSNGRLWSFQLK